KEIVETARSGAGEQAPGPPNLLMPYRSVDVVEVRCWGSRVGAVALDDRSGFYAFEYDPSWSRTGVALAPTTMPTTGRSRTFLFPALPAITYHRLPSLLADCLPDD